MTKYWGNFLNNPVAAGVFKTYLDFDSNDHRDQLFIKFPYDNQLLQSQTAQSEETQKKLFKNSETFQVVQQFVFKILMMASILH